MKKFFLLLSVLLGVALVACLEQPEITEVKDVDVGEMRDSTIHVTYTVLVKNPNNKNLHAESVTFDIFYEDNKIGEGGLIHDPLLKENSVTALKGETFIGLDKLLEVMPEENLGEDIEVLIRLEMAVSKLKVNVHKEFLHTLNIAHLMDNTPVQPKLKRIN